MNRGLFFGLAGLALVALTACSPLNIIRNNNQAYLTSIHAPAGTVMDVRQDSIWLVENGYYVSNAQPHQTSKIAVEYRVALPEMTYCNGGVMIPDIKTDSIRGEIYVYPSDIIYDWIVDHNGDRFLNKQEVVVPKVDYKTLPWSLNQKAKPFPFNTVRPIFIR